MKIISCNVNGVRASFKKGLADFIDQEKPDIFCLQEIKANEADFPIELTKVAGYQLFVNPASRKGYSGVAIYTKEKPIAVNSELGLERFDQEGRLLELDYPDFTIINLYFPHGGRQKENLEYKMQVYDKVIERVKSLPNKNVILIGDFNIAHQEIDLARPKQNRNNIMFTIEERCRIDELISLGFSDSFRQLSHESGCYTWWSYAFDAKARNMGWRIDYIFVSSNLAAKLTKANIYDSVIFSDHCPVGMEIKK